MVHGKNPVIILLGHGSRVVNAGENMEKVAQRLKQKYDYETVEYCFMSRLGPHFPETLEKVVNAGASDILVIPYFLHGGLHIRLDIPEMMQEEAAKYPGIKLALGSNLGYDEAMVDLVYQRITESVDVDDIRDMDLPPKEQFPVPEGQPEFVPMPPDEARKYMETHEDNHH